MIDQPQTTPPIGDLVDDVVKLLNAKGVIVTLGDRAILSTAFQTAFYRGKAHAKN